MSKSQLNLQDSFLNQVRKENIPVVLYLTSGVQLRGQVRGFDAFTVILEGQGKPPQLVYKHSIVSVAPQRHSAALLGIPPGSEEAGIAGEEPVGGPGGSAPPIPSAPAAPSLPPAAPRTPE